MKQAWRDLLGWFRQTDAFNCGPLAVAAAITALQGHRPIRQSLSAFPEALDPTGAYDMLRDSIVAFFLQTSAQRVGHTWRTLPWMVESGVTAKLQTWSEVFWDRPVLPAVCAAASDPVSGLRWRANKANWVRCWGHKYPEQRSAYLENDLASQSWVGWDI